MVWALQMMPRPTKAEIRNIFINKKVTFWEAQLKGKRYKCVHGLNWVNFL